MNKENLHNIFSNYIKKFEIINNPANYEIYKWEVAYSFSSLMNPDSPDFLSNFHKAVKITSNLIDSANRYPFSSLYNCAQKDEEAVKNLFRNLFAEDNGDLDVRQKKIEKFIMDANELIEKLHSSNNVFMNDQRSAMAYLFLNDPDNHYLYKASEAKDFASCVEFYDDWGSGNVFNLKAYYKMCDMLVDEIKACPELIETHKSRYETNSEKELHPDVNYHILAFDIIYGAPENRYNFYEGIPFSAITAEKRKLYQERVKKAEELYNEVLAAQEKADLLNKAKKYYLDNLNVGDKVKHKAFGTGTITEIDSESIIVRFDKSGETKKFILLKIFDGGFIKADLPDIEEKIAEFHPIANAIDLDKKLDRAEKAFEPYAKYLE